MSSPPCSDRHLENNNCLPRCEALHNQRQILKGQALPGEHHTISDHYCRIESIQLNTEGESMGKKLNHNAKERIRRRNLTASYLALRSLLPNCRRSKKKMGAPFIIDRALAYIPELEIEIEKLNLIRQSMKPISKGELLKKKSPSLELRAPTMSVTEVRIGELILQICMPRNRDDDFSSLLQKVEEEGMCITSSSSLWVCDDRVCYHLHVQMNGSSVAPNPAALKDKATSWLS